MIEFDNDGNIVEEYKSGKSVSWTAKKYKLKNPILIGHSFGGKLAVFLAEKTKVNYLVLLSFKSISS